MLAKILIFNVIFHAVMAAVYAAFLRGAIEQHVDEIEVPFKPLLKCSLFAFLPSLILSTVLVGTGLWQVFPSDTSQQLSRSWIIDVSYFVFLLFGVYQITKWNFQKHLASLATALEVSINRVLFSSALKTCLLSPLVIFVTALVVLPLLSS